MPQRWVNVRPKKRTVILCIDPDSDSDIVIEEEGDFRERCIIVKGEERNIEEEAEQADDEQSEQLTEAGTEPGMSLTAEQETEDKDETISSTLTQDFDREKVEREFIYLTSHYQQIGEFQEIGRRGAAYEEASTGNPFCKDAYTTHGQSDYRRESVIHVRDNDMKNLVKYRKSMIQKYMERVWRRSYRALLTALENSPHYFWWLLGTALLTRSLKQR